MPSALRLLRLLPLLIPLLRRAARAAREARNMAVQNQEVQIEIGPAAAVSGADVWYHRWGYEGTWRIESAHMMPNNAQTANGTNYATYTLNKGANVAGLSTIATRSLAATDSVAGTPEALTVTAGVTVGQGDLLSWAKADSGSGLAGHNTCILRLRRIS